MSKNNQEITRLTKKFQTLIPKKIREKKGLEAGSKIAWILNKDGTISLQKIGDDSEITKFVGIVLRLPRPRRKLWQNYGGYVMKTAVDTNIF